MVVALVRLTDLAPSFLRREARDEPCQAHKDNGYLNDAQHVHTDDCWETRRGVVYLPYVDRIEDAQGVAFLCPKCFKANGGATGTHSVICWSRSRGIPDDAKPGPGRWLLVGSGLVDLTLNGDGGSRSVAVIGGCAWHGFVTNGEVTDA